MVNHSSRNENVPVVVLEQMELQVVQGEEVAVPHFGKGILLVAKLGLQGVGGNRADMVRFQVPLVFRLVHQVVLLLLVVHWALLVYFQEFLACLIQNQEEARFL